MQTEGHYLCGAHAVSAVATRLLGAILAHMAARIPLKTHLYPRPPPFSTLPRAFFTHCSSAPSSFLIFSRMAASSAFQAFGAAQAGLLAWRTGSRSFRQQHRKMSTLRLLVLCLDLRTPEPRPPQAWVKTRVWRGQHLKIAA